MTCVTGAKSSVPFAPCMRSAQSVTGFKSGSRTPGSASATLILLKTEWRTRASLHPIVMRESDTPLTDAEMCHDDTIAERNYEPNGWVPADFCQTLERELNSRKDMERDLNLMLATFRHIHVNNGQDDSCRQCGLDLRHPVHARSRA